MNEREFNNTLWRAFYLGLKVLSHHQEQDLSSNDIQACGTILREIAESDVTLHDPTASANRFPFMTETVQRMGGQSIRLDRALARQVFDGFVIVTETKE